jgi:hypothetical protein
MSSEMKNPQAVSPRGSCVWLPALVAHFTISLAVAHALFAEFVLVKASFPHFCATAASFIAIVVVVARTDPDASRSNVNALCERCGRKGKDCYRSYGKDVRAH